MQAYKFLENKTNTKIPENFFKAGLSAFRLREINLANNYFKKCNNLMLEFPNEYYPNLRTSCLFWEAKVTATKKIKRNLYVQASKFDRTMYGQLAIEKLNKQETFIWEKPKYENFAHNHNLFNLKIFQRLIALSELNFYDKADLDMRNLYSSDKMIKSGIKYYSIGR